LSCWKFYAVVCTSTFAVSRSFVTMWLVRRFHSTGSPS